MNHTYAVVGKAIVRLWSWFESGDHATRCMTMYTMLFVSRTKCWSKREDSNARSFVPRCLHTRCTQCDR